MALHNYTFTTSQSRLLQEILYDEMKSYQDLIDDLGNDPKISQGDIDYIKEQLVQLKTMYSQIIKKV